MEVTLFGITIEVRLKQEENAHVWREDTVLGRTIDVIRLHEENA